MSDAAKAYELPANDATVIDRVVRDGDRVLITRNGVTLAAIVPLEDLKTLEAIEAEEDAHDLATLRAFDARVAAGTAEVVSFDQALADMGLTRADLRD